MVQLLGVCRVGGLGAARACCAGGKRVRATKRTAPSLHLRMS